MKHQNLVAIIYIIITLYLHIQGISCIDLTSTIEFFVTHRHDFGNQEDFNYAQRLFSHLNSVGACKEENAIIIGGLNLGQYAHHIIDRCPLRLFGFEIGPQQFAKVSESFKHYPQAHLFNMGMGDSPGEETFVGSESSMTGFYHPQPGERFYSDSNTHSIPIKIIPLCVFMDQQVEKIYPNVNLIYTSIDTEGFEAMVIHGMALQQIRNRKRFAVFQFELGGTWATHDPRHPKGSMTQEETTRYLQNRGYHLYLIGRHNLLQVNADFFKEGSHMEDEGYGLYIQGNLLAVHPTFAHPEILNFLKNDVIKL